MTAHMRNDEVFGKMESTMTLIRSMRKIQFGYILDIIRKENLENLPLKGHIKGKRIRGKKCLTYRTSPSA